MFELSVACKYLIPRRRQISVSIISLISILVIALVVWLIVVFFSVTDGLEKNWVNKLTALTAPVRITPTEAYFNSYYYQIDSISDSSGYSHKTIGEKMATMSEDPYDPQFDQEIPSFWPSPDLNADGSLKDLVQGVFASLQGVKGVPGISGKDFELTASHIRLRLQRDAPVFHAHNIYGGTTQSYLAYPTYLGNFEADNPHFDQIVLPATSADFSNYFNLLDVREDAAQDENNEKLHFSQNIFNKRLERFFQMVSVKELKARSFGWTIPHSMLPKSGSWEVLALLKGQIVKRLVVPVKLNDIQKLQKTLEDQGVTATLAKLSFKEEKLFITLPNQEEQILDHYMPITLEGGALLNAKLIPGSISIAKRLSDVKFAVAFTIQGSQIEGQIPYRGLELGKIDASNPTTTPFWVYREGSTYILPKDPDIGEGVLLPKSFRDAGVFLGDRGKLSYIAPTASTLQEHYIPIYVAGFYDPGIIPIGGKFILANSSIASLIRSSHQLDDKTALTNGINVHFDKISQADEVKAQLSQMLQAKGLSRYWTIETYKEYDFTKAIIQELQSQKNIFILISIVIIVVACSNIISMLIILVNDKMIEIGILRSMGASTKSIAFIFGLAGAVIGVLGSALGIAGALLTLQNMNTLISFLSQMQGYDVFNSSLYGEVLPHEISYEALLFVIGATVIISLLAGIVPAVKACLLRPSTIFRSSGG
jgi:lipoprotein-releasing system permease protein